MTARLSTVTGNWKAALALFAALAVLTGCSGPKRLASLSGKVTYKGKPVSVGAVYFHGPAGELAMGNLKEDGSFVATDLPIGEVRVSLKVQDPGIYAQQLKSPPSLDPGKSENGDRVTSLPNKFADPASSGLAYTLTPSTTTLEIAIE